MQIQVITKADGELRDAAKELDAAVGSAIRTSVTQIAVTGRAKVERRIGRAANSVQPVVNGDATTIIAGAEVAYWKWLRFGGAVGRRHSVRRAVVRGGRYFPPRVDMERQVVDAVENAVERVLREEGLT